MSPEYPEAVPGEQVFVDYDDEHEVWGVFGEESGHCYATGTKDEAAAEASRRNNALWA